MKFEWDENKNKANQSKHALSFEEAIKIFELPRYTQVVEKKTFKETRYITIGDLKRNALVLVVYTRRRKHIRIISARIAKRKERKAYHAFIKKTSPRNR